MAELTENINIRTTRDTKKKVMDEAAQIGINITEYVTYVLESYWAEQSNVKEEKTAIQALESQLSAYQKRVEELTVEKEELLAKTAQEAMNLSTEKIEKEKALAVQQFQEEANRVFNEEHLKVVQPLKERLKLYESHELKTVFEAVRSNPKIHDLPDVVNVLISQYYQQFITQ